LLIGLVRENFREPILAKWNPLFVHPTEKGFFVGNGIIIQNLDGDKGYAAYYYIPIFVDQGRNALPKILI
jgi:hypothetical protein